MSRRRQPNGVNAAAWFYGQSFTGVALAEPPVWRIQVRKDGRVVRSEQGLCEATLSVAFALMAKANAEAGAYDNIELQKRDAGAARFRPIRQAVGAQIIEWGAP